MDGMKIVGDPFFKNKRQGKQKVKEKEPLKSGFPFLLKSEEKKIEPVVLDTEEQDRQLEELLDDIHELGEQIKKNPTMAQIRDYKEAIRGFMKQVLADSLVLEEKISGRNILKRKRYTIIKIIDQKLERLAASVLKNQRESLNYLQRIDEIYGLLVDLKG